MRDAIAAATKTAMREKDATRLATLRLVNAAIKDRDIAARSDENPGGATDAEILELLSKMIKQRDDSIKAYEEGGRLDLAERERVEIQVIKQFLPQPLTEAETVAAIQETIGDVRAEGLRDMGKVIAALKQKYPGRMDFSKVAPQVKAALTAA